MGFERKPRGTGWSHALIVSLLTYSTRCSLGQTTGMWTSLSSNPSTACRITTQVASGTTAAATCVSDGSGNYGNNERCSFTLIRTSGTGSIPVTYRLLAATGNVRSSTSPQSGTACTGDYLTIGTTRRCGTYNGGISNVVSGTQYSWRTDHRNSGNSRNREGFTLCAPLLVTSAPTRARTASPTTQSPTTRTPTTRAPTSPTVAPSDPTTAPTSPTSAPTNPTTAPTDPTTAPTSTTTAPTNPTAGPTNPTIAPSASTSSPSTLAPTQTIVPQTGAPTNPTLPPTNPSSAPSTSTLPPSSLAPANTGSAQPTPLPTASVSPTGAPVAATIAAPVSPSPTTTLQPTSVTSSPSPPAAGSSAGSSGDDSGTTIILVVIMFLLFALIAFVLVVVKRRQDDDNKMLVNDPRQSGVMNPVYVNHAAKPQFASASEKITPNRGNAEKPSQTSTGSSQGDTVAVGQVFYQVPDGTIKPEQPQYAPTSGMDLKYAAPEIQNFGFDDTNEGQVGGAAYLAPDSGPQRYLTPSQLNNQYTTPRNIGVDGVAYTVPSKVGIQDESSAYVAPNLDGAAPDILYAVNSPIASSSAKTMVVGDNVYEMTEEKPPDTYAAPATLNGAPVTQPVYAATNDFTNPIASAPVVSGVQGAFGARATIQSWLSANVDRPTAERALKQGGYDAGAFCIRNGSKGAVLTALSKENKVVHYRINQVGGGKVALDISGPTGKVLFADIYKLVEHFSTTPATKALGVLKGCILLPTADRAIAPVIDDGNQLYAVSNGTGFA